MVGNDGWQIALDIPGQMLAPFRHRYDKSNIRGI
ncbi:MAG: hypothetical protein N838_20840 [Thiohalocapsa sp. PB-PSB1]|nr:MAG: hypothetical protein N838_20840 [Thiohalocapsa sp. PB-PSB1]